MLHSVVLKAVQHIYHAKCTHYCRYISTWSLPETPRTCHTLPPPQLSLHYGHCQREQFRWRRWSNRQWGRCYDQETKDSVHSQTVALSGRGVCREPVPQHGAEEKNGNNPRPHPTTYSGSNMLVGLMFLSLSLSSRSVGSYRSDLKVFLVLLHLMKLTVAKRQIKQLNYTQGNYFFPEKGKKSCPRNPQHSAL